jgi:glycosyltransferase involved in cell wall biosynthesis
MEDLYTLLGKIYSQDVPEHRSSPLKFGVCMATYKRANGKSPAYLKRSISSVFLQTATNWHLYIVGDDYSDRNEFTDLMQSLPSEKVTFHNNDSSPEREHLKTNELWSVAGVTAMNKSRQLALDDGCDYILHLDDDDFFHQKKIQMLNCLYSYMNNIPASFIFHYSTHANPTAPILPREDHQGRVHINTIRPECGNCIHASYCIHRSVLSNFQMKGYEPGKYEGYMCGDMQFLTYLRSYLDTHSDASVVFLPFLLCAHEQEGEAYR